MSAPRDELARLVAYVFSVAGRRRIPEEDWVRTVSLERKWLSPSKARQAAEAARRDGLLRNAGARDYEIGLEAEGLQLPIDYRPDPASLENALAGGKRAASAPVPLFLRIVRAIAEKTGASESETVAAINQSPLTAHGLVRAEVAALAYARLQGVETEPFLEEAEKEVLG